MRRIFLLLLCLVAVGLLPGFSYKKRLYSEPEYKVTDYGAIADAVEASGANCSDNPPICSTAGTGTNSATAFNAAIDAAGAAGGGVVFVPCGSYRVGDASGLSSGILIDQDNIHLKGESRDCVTIMPGTAVVSGVDLVSVCESTGTTCDSSAAITNPEISGITFKLDDPETHAQSNYATIDEGTLASALNGAATAYADYSGTVAGAVLVTDNAHGLETDDAVIIDGTTDAMYDGWFMVTKVGNDDFYIMATWDSNPAAKGTWGAAPALGQSVSWSAGAETGIVVRYNYTAGGTSYIRVAEISPSTLANNDDVTEAGASDWTASTIQIERDNTGSDVRAIRAERTINLYVHDNTFDSLSGDGVNINSTSSGNPATNSQVYNNIFTNCPSISSSASCLSIRGADHTRVLGNSFDGGVRSYDGANGLLSMANPVGASVTTTDTLVASNHFIETSTDEVDQVDQGITWSPSGLAIADTVVTGNVIDVDVLADPTVANNRALVYHTATNAITGTNVNNNRIFGGIFFSGHADNTFTVVGNAMSGTIGRGMDVSGADYVISGNLMENYPLEAIRVVSTTVNATITNNDVRNTTTDGSAVGQIYLASSTAVTGAALISGNTIEGIAAAAIVNGIDCSEEPDAMVVGNSIINADHTAIRDCLVARSNRITAAGVVGIFLDTVTHGDISGNMVDGVGGSGIHCDNCQYTTIIGNTVSGCTSPGIYVSDMGVDGTSDYNICFGNTNLDSGETIMCSDTGVAGPGDDYGCTDEGGSPDGLNTYCGGNIVTP